MTRLVRPDELPVGARVARAVLSGHTASAPLLRAGAVVTESIRSALERSGVHGVYIDDEPTGGIEPTPALDERTRLEVTNALAVAFAEAPAALSEQRALRYRTVADLESTVVSIIDDILDVDVATLALSSLASAEAYTLEHSIDVAVLGLLTANRLFRERGRIDYTGERTHSGISDALHRFGIGLLLHDVGKLGLPAAIAKKQGPLSEEERDIVREHPLVGLGLLDEAQVSSHAVAVVRWHHEQFDGNGYPDGLRGAAIPQFARIAAVADAYSALTTPRPFHDATPPQIALARIRAGAGSFFDPEVVEVFGSLVAPYPPGSALTLADGQRGVVVRVRPEQLDRPLVRVVRDRSGAPVEPYDIDLFDDSELAPAA